MEGSSMYTTLFVILTLFTVTGCEGARRNPTNRGKATVAPTVNSSLLLRCDRKTIHLTKSSGTIRSPGYPHEYAENQRCTWRVQVPRGFRIRIRFRRQFDIEQSPHCSKDYLMLSDKKNFRDVPKYCGSMRPRSSFLVPHNSVWIRFRSDNNTTGKGFYISYTSEDENECKKDMCTFPTLCRNTVGSYECDCPPGYANKGPKQSARCEDIDECKTGNGRCQHKCVNTEGSFYCMCKKGYKLAADERRCKADQNECNTHNGGCSHLCVNSRSSHYCSCPHEYVLHSDKKTCYPEISFYDKQYTVTVSEDEQPNTVITKVQARTFPLTHSITYTLLSENLKKPSLFAINSRTGEIMVKHILARVKGRNFLLELEASFQVPDNPGDRQRRSTKYFLLINVRDPQSENTLSFTNSTYHLKIPCNVSQDETVFRVQTADTENSRHLRIRYRFQKKLDYFHITPNGKMKVKRSLLLYCFLTPAKTFQTTLIARDTSGVRRNAHALMRIVVTPPGQLYKVTASVIPDTKNTITPPQPVKSSHEK